MGRLALKPKALAWGVATFVFLAGALGLVMNKDFGELWLKSAGPSIDRALENATQSAIRSTRTPETKAPSETAWAPPAEIADRAVVEHRSTAEDKLIWHPPQEIAPQTETPAQSPRSE